MTNSPPIGTGTGGPDDVRALISDIATIFNQVHPFINKAAESASLQVLFFTIALLWYFFNSLDYYDYPEYCSFFFLLFDFSVIVFGRFNAVAIYFRFMYYAY